jgi:4-aminobutyrate aminotransferase
MDWEAGSHASTFGGNPVSCAAALATVDLLEEGLMKNAAERGRQFMDGLQRMQLTYECLGDVRGLGLMIGVELVKDRETRESAVDWRNGLIRSAFNRGLLLLGCGESTIRFCPALTISPEEVDVGLSIFEECVREVAH